MGPCLADAEAVLVRSSVKRSSIMLGATYDHETVGSTAFAPPGPHLGRQNVMQFHLVVWVIQDSLQ